VSEKLHSLRREGRHSERAYYIWAAATLRRLLAPAACLEPAGPFAYYSAAFLRPFRLCQIHSRSRLAPFARPAGSRCLMDYEVQRCTRHCTATGRELKPGEVYYSTLVSEGARVLRHDYAAEAWQGPPEGIVGWWKSVVPHREGKRMHWAPNDVMLELLEELEGQDDKQDMRYVLSLLLVRRRVLRLEEMEQDPSGGEKSILYCPKREKNYEVQTVTPDDARAAAIQEELARLLVATSE
jgi:hypothetical protein